VQAVLKALDHWGRQEPLLVDAPGLLNEGFSLELDRLTYRGRTVCLSNQPTGWLRRYAPTEWGTGSVAGSLEAVTKRAFLSFVGSISRLGDCRWLTPLDAMLASEDRLVQLQVAARLGFRTPRTIVSSDAAEVAKVLGDVFVVKPLSGGYFVAADGPRAVFATRMSADEAEGIDFGAAPFVAQEFIPASQHLRVVTVGTTAWVGVLDAASYPMDWRQDDAAHFSWRRGEDDEAAASAVKLAGQLGVGYSSQDWIRGDALTFLDLNPGGQWLFLPPEISVPVTAAIAKHLGGGSA
jgi:hypothetical protein